jgi:ABC-type sulfate transport system permease subunit
MRYITLPLARRSILAGVILASARAMGEFGVTLMIAGNIPGRTQTLPLAIYDAVQTRQYDEANMMVLVLSALALVYIWGLVQVGRPIRLRKHKEKPHFSHSSSKATGSSALLFQRNHKSKILDVFRVTTRDRS